MDVDPMPIWRTIAAPVLFLFGDASLDRLAPVARSAELAEQLRQEGRDVTVVTMPGADHSFNRGGKPVAPAEPIMTWLRRRP